MKKNGKQRLFEIFERVNGVKLKEWYDDEYHNKPQEPKGIGGFGNIDWQMLHNTLLFNTEEIEAGRHGGSNVGDLTDQDGLLSFDELNKLRDFELIEINDGYPEITNPQYNDYQTFKNKAAEIWNKETPTSTVEPSQNYEIPYLRGNEPES